MLLVLVLVLLLLSKPPLLELRGRLVDRDVVDNEAPAVLVPNEPLFIETSKTNAETNTREARAHRDTD